MRRTDQVCALFWFILGGVITFESARLGLGSLKEPGPGFMCFVTGSLIVIFGIALFVKSSSVEAYREITSEPFIGENWMKVGIVTASLIAYVISLSSIGYIIGTFLLLGFLLNISHAKGWPIRVIAAAFITLFTFIAFRTWLSCPLPKGIFSIGF